MACHPRIYLHKTIKEQRKFNPLKNRGLSKHRTSYNILYPANVRGRLNVLRHFYSMLFPDGTDCSIHVKPILN